MQRRAFLYNFFWLTGGLVASCNKRLNLLKSDGNFVTGKVTANGKGLENVVVSDGFSVVKTAKNGAYEMQLTSASEHVFVSVPAGYAFPHQKNIAAHYTTVGANNYDFELTALAKDDHQHKFMIWADPQVKNEKDVEKLMSQSVPDVQQFMQSLPADELIHGICVGDIVWDNQALFTSYNAAIEKCGLPFFQVIGNHDMDYRQGGDETSDNTFKKMYGPSYYSFNRGEVHYVVLDDVWYLGKERDYKGFISQEQLDWLKKDLAFVAKNKLIVLCLHIPVHNGVENNTALYEILKPYNVHIMSGHTHYNNNIIKENVYEHVHGTVCGAWWTGPICGDGTPPGYAVYEVNGTDISWHYKSVGQDANHQVRAMMVDTGNGNKELVANVWNWDPTWKIEWMADGINQGPLTRQTDFDPLAVQLYLGDQLPKSRPFVEPKKTEHIFKTIVPKGVTQVKVMATDRFGKQYHFTV